MSGQDERAISPVVGGVLMVVIVILLGAVTATMALGFTDLLADSKPVVANAQSVEVALENNETTHTLEFVHQSGDAIPAGTLRVQVGAGDDSVTYSLSAADGGALADGSWTAGEHLRIDLDESQVCGGRAPTVDVTLVHSPSPERSYVMSSRSVPIERGQFVITGQRVETTANYTATVTFLGTGWSAPGLDFPVNVSVEVDGKTEHRWTSVTDTNATVGTYEISSQAAGTDLSVSARGLDTISRYSASNAEPYFRFDSNGDGTLERYHLVSGTWVETSGSANSDYMTVLRNGDPVPNFDAAEGQQSAAAYADPYIDDNGTISLADNQAIFLFDFNHDDAPSDVDYQDAVVLVSFFSQDQTVSVHQDGTGRDVVVCPAETTGGN
ncbi:type IV pilin [Natronomonas sp. EA1]|uniref:type IV pilin n=1 Tax=Natronomonas sp. EA1 TaxID=3421655 RepID=UPI003EBDC3FA